MICSDAVVHHTDATFNIIIHIGKGLMFILRRMRSRFKTGFG